MTDGGYDDPATQDPNKRDLYEDQVPPHAPGDGAPVVPVAPEVEVPVVDPPAEPEG